MIKIFYLLITVHAGSVRIKYYYWIATKMYNLQ